MKRMPIGIDHFKRRMLTLQEAGLARTIPAVLQLEYIQFYIHIFQMPVISTRAGWYARYEDGALAQLPDDIVGQLNAVYRPRFSLWACQGALLLIATIMLAIFGKAIADY
ncbi:hypothetical protein [Chitinophaga rhizophila]|uniref:Uncharacterized protein n=1 Tax=Chitinophaga rhizophila TaxID=2866212 RepID=A0ABS7GHM1_9BACT|nr:hypothetical protein [Chitinophaga rhizophila]MBW8686630.1 hypothetical protein [Chitinophaga rhizophila]